MANTHANRSLTFGVRGRRGLVRQHARAALVFAFTISLTSAVLGLLHVARYVALRWWVFPGSIPGTSQASPRLSADAG